MMIFNVLQPIIIAHSLSLSAFTTIFKLKSLKADLKFELSYQESYDSSVDIHELFH